MSGHGSGMDREGASRRAREFFDDIWQAGDYWGLENSEFEQAKYERQIGLLQGSHYEIALDIGCGGGHFTRMLAPLVDCATGLDVAPSAIARAQAAERGAGRVEFRVENIMDHDFRADRPWDLVVMNETIYYLGWLYSFFDIARMANELFGATQPGGTVLMANTYGEISDYLLRPWIIRTHRDLFVNVGYTVKTEEVFRGEKSNVVLETLITVFVKPPSSELVAKVTV